MIRKFLAKCYRALRRVIRKIIIIFYPVRKYILFESVPDLSDNTKAVFDEMISRGINKKYKMFWKVSKNFEYPKYDNVFYINIREKTGQKYWRRLEWQAKCLISCNIYMISHKKRQISIYLSHGSPIKDVSRYYNLSSKVNYCLATSEEMIKPLSYVLNYCPKKMVPLGYPRNDNLIKNKIALQKILKTDCKKIIVWYPTFRQHIGGRKFTETSSLPIIHDSEKSLLLNEVAMKHNVMIVIKPHFAQDLRYIKEMNLSNIKFINDDFFVENNISSYEFVGNCDALITDYSSIYYDYTLCDKPIALIWEDIEEYKHSPGLIENYEYYCKGAEIIYNLEELENFIKAVSVGEDKLKVERNEIKNIVNFSTDGKNSKRVVNFILEKIGDK